MNDRAANSQPTVRLPIQSRPVHRDDWTIPSACETARGVEAAQSLCTDLHGMARQMCYATQYGVSV
jgi:hypothetical protein